MKKKPRGITRNGGRKSLYGEPTTTFSRRVPVSKKHVIGKYVDDMLNEWKIK